MKTKLFTIILVVLCATINAAFAQQIYSPGYIVIAGQDSSKGWIAELPASKRKAICLFQAIETGAVDSFTATSLVAYGFEDGPHYQSLLIRDKGKDSVTYYMERIVEGEANLYWYRDEVDSHFYLKSDKISGRLFRGGEEIIVTPRRVIKRKILDYKQLLIQLSSDKEQIAEEPKGVGLNRKDLTRFVHEWNSRTEAGARKSSIVKVKQPYSFAIGPMAQISQYRYNSGILLNPGIGAGVALTVFRPYGFNNIVIQFMPMITRQEFGEPRLLGTPVYNADSSRFSRRTAISGVMQRVTIPISVGKYWQFRSISPYLLLGTAITLYSEATSRIRTEEVQTTSGSILSSSTSQQTSPTSYKLPSFLSNIYLTPGLNVRLTPRMDIGIQVSMDLTYPAFLLANVADDNTRIQMPSISVMMPIRLGEM